METWPWTHLSRYCASPTHRTWVESELRQHPIPAGQSPEDWLLVRSLVSEGMTEAEARLMAFGPQSQSQTQSASGGGSGSGTSTGYASPGYPVVQQSLPQPQPHLQRQISNTGYGGPFNPVNGVYTGHNYAPAPVQEPPYGFVSLQEISPQSRSSSIYPNSQQTPSQTLPFYGVNHLNAQTQAAGTSPIPKSVQQNPPQQFEINPAPPTPVIERGQTATPSPRSDSPFLLQPPGSASSSTSFPIQGVALTVRAAPGTKRPISPLPSTATSKASSHSLQSHRKSKKNSSSIDPPSTPPIDGQKPAVSSTDKGKAKATASTALSATHAMTMPILRPLLIPEALQEPKPVQLFKNLRIRTVKGQDAPPLFTPDPSELEEIAVQLRDHASSRFLKAMADDDRYADVWQAWLRKFVKEPEKWDRAIAPVLQVLARTDMPVDFIIELRLGKLAKKIADLAKEKNLPSRQAIQSAFAKYNTYIVDVLLPAGRKSESALEEEAENKKRKIDEVVKEERKPNMDSTSKPGPSKLPAVSGTSASRPPIKSTTSATSNAVASKPVTKPSSTDMSFFGSAPATSSSAPKARTNLPPIKKLDRPAVPTIITPATSSTSSLLSATLKALGNRGLTATSNVTPEPAQEPKREKEEVNPPRYNAKGKIIGSVRFRDLVKEEEGGGNLEEVKIFKEEPWEMELPFWKIQTEEDVHGLSAHQLDQAEGAVLAAQRDHAVIDWYEPISYLENTREYPLNTPEVEAQTIRERGILAVSYPPGITIPDPSETDTRVVESSQNGTRYFPLSTSTGTEQIRNLFPTRVQPYGVSSSDPSPTTSVSHLLEGLKGLTSVIQPVQPQQQSQQTYNYDPQPPPPTQSYGQGGWGQSSYGNSSGSGIDGQRPSWGGNDNYASARNYGGDQNPGGNNSFRPQDRDRSRPICKFWSRGE
ncbi:hypothetical protein IAR55_006124 [Kwoniella newhampshirensis]|uniref:Uncharacterized protein n=1 Tax=Kwoniella newhampshirensis TaxID=1651941 RepID=A0AAW0YIL1_9TREE